MNIKGNEATDTILKNDIQRLNICPWSYAKSVHMDTLPTVINFKMAYN